MKVLFFYPSRAGKGSIPLNIPILIGEIKQRGHSATLFDLSDYDCFDVEREEYESNFYKTANYDYEKIKREREEFYNHSPGCGDYIISGDELRKTDYHHDFEILLEKYKPDIIAVSCLSVDFKFSQEFLFSFKVKYNIPVIYGGIHTILLPEEVINTDLCDYICIGEGENAFPNLLDALEGKRNIRTVAGIWFKDGNRVIRNPQEKMSDLNKLSIPNYHYFDPIHFYRPFDGKRYKMINYELSRGCPFNCSYCVNSTLKDVYKGLGKFHRTKNIENSIRELKYLINEYGFDFVRFWDDDFTSISTNYLEKYAEAYRKKINLPFLIAARVDTVTERKVEILSNMGCKHMSMGIESGNQHIRKTVMKRNTTDETIIKRYQLVKKYGIRVAAYNIIGLPGETRKEIFDTIEMNREVNPDSFSVTMLEPYRGTHIRSLCEEEGLDPNHETVYNRAQFVPKGIKKSELLGLFRAFPLYVRLPRNRFDEIRSAETNDDVYRRLISELGLGS